MSTASVSPAQLLDVVIAAFDWISTGFLITGVSGELLFANESGERILESRDGLSLDERGEVNGLVESLDVAASPADLKTMLAVARHQNGLILSLARPSGKLPLTLTLHPTRLESAQVAEGEGEALFVLIHDPESAVQVGYAELRELFGLTLAEARLTNLMMQGKSVEECTGLLGIRRSTVKMHLRNLYGKTGVQRQCELVSLMFKSFGNVRSAQRTLPPRERRIPRAQETAC